VANEKCIHNFDVPASKEVISCEIKANINFELGEIEYEVVE
jgi:hypothetical protein